MGRGQGREPDDLPGGPGPTGPIEASVVDDISNMTITHPFADSLELLAVTVARAIDGGDHSAALVRELRSTLGELGKGGTGSDGDDLDSEVDDMSAPV